MRQKVILYINGKRHEISGEAAFQPLSHYLRYTERLTGTKVVCAEGDCGACTVLKSQLPDPELIPINSCITIPALLDGSQLITIEGLEENTQPHPVQDAMIQNHGAQCGFCTPGIICSLASYFETHHEVTEKKIRNALTGNLCRCTGYEPILKSALAVSPKIAGNLQIRYLSDNDINQELLTLSTDDLLLKHGGSSCFAPINLPALLEYKKDHPEARIVASATDIGVMVNKGKTQFNKFCTLNRILDCSEIK